MQNFEFFNPTKIIFGKDTLGHLRELLPPKKILLLYGGGSIKNNGIYDAIQKHTTERDIIEFGGVLPNPTFEKCMEALKIIKQEDIGFILAVGGGSVIDAAKFLALASCYEGNPEDILTSSEISYSKALPIGVVLTLPATGSEMNQYFVISHNDQKISGNHPLVFPTFSILDPMMTMSLPQKQIGNGIVDAFVHVMEQYLTVDSRALVQDQFAESVLCTLIEVGPHTFHHPLDYDARANLMWSATIALNGILGCGQTHDWSTHAIGHELTSLYGIDHARTLAIVLPAVMWVMRAEKQGKLKQYAERVWQLQGSGEELVKQVVQKTQDFFESLGVPTKLSAYQLGPEVIPQITSRLLLNGQLPMGESGQITKVKVKEILEMAL